MEHPQTKCAVFALFGAPNAGKSTLINAILGEALAPVHRKAQMTRKNLVGLSTRNGCQLVFIDTPGFHEAERALNLELKAELQTALDDCERVLILLDAGQTIDTTLSARIAKLVAQKEVLIILN